MANPANLKSHWDIVGVVIKSRGRELQKYHYFEELWKSLQDGNQLIFLQAPTGAGKTEAVLVPFLKDLVNGEREWHSLLYVLPTRSLVFNMFHRICKALNACKHFFGKPERVVIDYDHGGFTPFKAFIEGDLTITTYDTLLYTSYGFRSYGHHYLLSMGKIAGSLVILDEIQLLQDAWWYSLSLLPYHIVNLVVFGATVIVMTATLPHLLIEEVEEPLKSFERRQEMKYPRISIEMDPNKDIVKRGKVDVNIKEGKLLNSILDIAKNYEKPMLLIFNTVERAVESYYQLVKNGYNDVILLHSRIISEERKKRESSFEKKGSINHDLIVVATQVIEAGLDYDFKTVATEISPVDSLIQRLGRCGRKSDGVSLVFKDLDQTKSVYPEVIVSETERVLDKHLLEESIKNVSVASSLVDEVYSEKVVKGLKSEVSSELISALNFIKTFPTDKIFEQRTLFDKQAQNIFRLGIEVRCILLPQEIYQKILGGVRSVEEDKTLIELPLNQAINLLNQNTLSLSIKKLSKNLEIPSLKHQVDGKEVYLSLSITPTRTNHNVNCEMEIVKYDNLFKAIKSQGGFIHLLIINPSYYLFEGGYHLGLVKPYGETVGM
jgi:CRISPR-associated endonuclease/helicase Cas3